MMEERIVLCGGCGDVIDQSPDTPMGKWPPCPQCGDSDERSITTTIDGVIQGRVSTGLKAKRPGGKWEIETKHDVFSFSRTTGNRKLFMYTVNRRRNSYRKRLVDTVTGVWLESWVRLSDHTGHGSARRTPGRQTPEQPGKK